MEPALGAENRSSLFTDFSFASDWLRPLTGRQLFFFLFCLVKSLDPRLTVKEINVMVLVFFVFFF